MIESTRLTIKPFYEADAEAFFELTKDDGFNLFPITIYRQKNVADALEWIKNNNGKYAVWEKETHSLIGMGGITPWEFEKENLMDVTYRLRESAWGKGYGMELAQTLVDYGSKTLGLKNLTATITPDNVASKKIAEKLGMIFDKQILLKGIKTDLYRLK
jgi:[ribosomal protein S5]-alanine N-acetyltransferase